MPIARVQRGRRVDSDDNVKLASLKCLDYKIAKMYTLYHLMIGKPEQEEYQTLSNRIPFGGTYGKHLY